MKKNPNDGGEYMYPCNERSALPTICMIGGGKKNLYFRVSNERSGIAVDVTDCSGRFSIISKGHRTGRPIVQKDLLPAAQFGEDVMTVTLLPEDTASMEGKYVYQVWVVGDDGTPEEPSQGVLYVTKNIDQGFLKN